MTFRTACVNSTTDGSGAQLDSRIPDLHFTDEEAEVQKRRKVFLAENRRNDQQAARASGGPPG